MIFGVLLASLRTVQLGTRFLVINASILVTVALVSLLLRADKHLKLRGRLLITGCFANIFLGMMKLGLATPAIYSIPFLAALAAFVVSGRLVTLIILANVAFMILMSIYHTTGHPSLPDITMREWSANPRNWFVATISVAFLSALMAYMVRGLTHFWNEAETRANLGRQQLEAIVEFAPDAIFLLDWDTGQFLGVNDKAKSLFGIASETIRTLEDFSALSPEFQPSGEASAKLGVKYAERALQEGRSNFEWVHQNKDGVRIICDVELTRIPPMDQKLLRVSIRDITKRVAEQKEREELRQQLSTSQRREMIGELTGGIAHDFNNLLAVILGNLELSREEPDEQKHNAMIETSIEAALRGADLTRNMLAFARQAPLQPKIVDLNKIVLDTKNWCGRVVPANIQVETSLLARLWKVKADQTNTESALLNLIVNARDAMPEGGKLTLETSNVRIEETYYDSRQEELAPGRYVMVAVSDTGTGIPEQDAARIFDPFFTTKPTDKGSGLGLAMVAGFMRQSGGTAQVYSELGVGTTFKLYFPAVTDSTGSDIESEPAAIDHAKTEARVLLVEDQSEVLKVLEASLKQAGYSVTSATSGDEAKRIFASNPNYDLLITDIVMPGRLQGTTLAKELRELGEQLPVIFMSGYAAEATVHGNGLRPEDIRLMKPVRRAKLLEAVSQAIFNDSP